MRAIELIEALKINWNSTQVGFLLPVLRPICEDLIVLTFLSKYTANERVEILMILLKENSNDGIKAQASFSQNKDLGSQLSIKKYCPTQKTYNVLVLNIIGHEKAK